jgi:hypothetical protein
VALPQPHASPAAVLGDELAACLSLRGICVFFQQSIEFINPLFDANYGVFRRASDDSVPGRYLPRFKRFELPLKRRSHLNPVLNQIVYCRHSATSPVFAEHSRKIAPARGRGG